MNFYRFLLPVLLLLAIPALLPLPVAAQTAVTTDDVTSVELLQNRVKEIESSKDPEETLLLEFYRKSISLIEQQRSYEQAASEFIQERERIPRQAAALREELAVLEDLEPPSLPEALSQEDLSALNQRLLGEKADVSSLSGTLGRLEASLEAQSQRPQHVRNRLNEDSRDQATIQEKIKSVAAEGHTPRRAEAQRWSLEFELRALSAEMEMLNQELLSHPFRIELLGVQRDKATLELNRKLDFVDQLEALVTERRLSEAVSARVAADETERQSFGKHVLVQEFASRNTELGDELEQLATELENIIQEENEAAVKAKRVGANFRLTKQKLDITGLNEALGEMLLEQRRALPNSTDFDAADKRRQRLIIESSLRQIRNQQERARLRDIDVYVEEQMVSLSGAWKSLLRGEVLALSELRRDLLDKAIAADDTYLQALGELDFTRRQLSETVTSYNNYLSERLLWIRTGKRPSWEILGSITEGLGVFASPAHWMEIGQTLAHPDSFPWVLLSGTTLFVVLMILRKRLRASLERSSKNVGQLRHDRILYSFKALALTLVLALPWPVLFTALGLQLQFVLGNEAIDLGSGVHQTLIWTGQFVPAIGAAFSGIALYTYYFVAFRIFCEPEGLAVAHFGWNPTKSAQLRLQTRRLMTIFLPIGFLLIAAITYDPAALAGGLSRLLFVIVMAALAWFFGRILTPRFGVLTEFYAANPGNPLAWFRYVWFLLGMILPVILGILAFEGYVYTAAQFGQRLIDTLWLVVVIILIHQLVVRWLLLTERSLAFRDALERHRLQRAAREASEEEGNAEEMEALQLEEPEIDFQALGEDTARLINAVLLVVAGLGLWLIWAEVNPAFRFLEEYSLWSRTVVLDDETVLVPVTVNDLLLGLLAILMVVVAARRLPALLEFVLLARINISAGSRYAIASLTQYCIVATGVIMVFNLFGGNWSEIQWLIAALGVGIGFGLQEIVANFICGLILLFERPIRIGDVVTVGETDGVVTKIQIRSTTIRNWDQKELLVPNKEFVTGRLLNWTLTDPITRIVVPVGIAYGSDVELAIKLIQQIAEEHERVLEEPAFIVTFDSFDDSAMTVVLRCFISSMDYWRQTTSELHLEINEKFKEAGIVIAFPQRDIHLTTEAPLDVRVLPSSS